MTKIRIDLNEARDEASILLDLTPERTVTLKMDADTLSNFITKLGHSRDKMLPAVANKPPAATLVRAFPNPSVLVESDAMHGLPLVHVRDPRFGWLHYSMTKEHASKLGEALMRRAQAEPEPMPRKAN